MTNAQRNESNIRSMVAMQKRINDDISKDDVKLMTLSHAYVRSMKIRIIDYMLHEMSHQISHEDIDKVYTIVTET